MVQAVNLLHNHSDFAHDPYFVDAQGRHDIYRMMVVGFRQPLVALFYIIAVGLLCLHLSHGISAMFQSLGWKKRAYARFLDNAAQSCGMDFVPRLHLHPFFDFSAPFRR